MFGLFGWLKDVPTTERVQKLLEAYPCFEDYVEEFTRGTFSRILNLWPCKHFDIGAWSKEQKRLKQKSLELNNTIAGLNEDIASKEQAIKDLKQKRGSLLNKQVKLPRTSSIKKPSFCTPSNSEKLDLPQSVARKRRKLMFTNAVAVNAPSSDNAESKREYALNGLWNTFINTASEYEVKQYLLNSSKVMKKVLPTIVNTAVNRYELGQSNLVRSVAVLYEGGISSKSQYNRKRSKEIFEIDERGRNTRAKKTKFDKGVNQMDDEDNEGDLHPPVSGCFRDLECFLIKLAKLYLVINQKRPGYLNWFGLPVGSFQVAIGADGAPFAPSDMKWLAFISGELPNSARYFLSFANVSKDDIAK
ncbi:Hypothetical predicted protein, partial [Paramuricea clavata]